MICLIFAPVFANTLRIPTMIFFFSSSDVILSDFQWNRCFFLLTKQNLLFQLNVVSVVCTNGECFCRFKRFDSVCNVVQLCSIVSCLTLSACLMHSPMSCMCMCVHLSIANAWFSCCLFYIDTPLHDLPQSFLLSTHMLTRFARVCSTRKVDVLQISINTTIQEKNSQKDAISTIPK